MLATADHLWQAFGGVKQPTANARVCKRIARMRIWSLLTLSKVFGHVLRARISPFAHLGQRCARILLARMRPGLATPFAVLGGRECGCHPVALKQLPTHRANLISPTLPNTYAHLHFSWTVVAYCRIVARQVVCAIDPMACPILESISQLRPRLSSPRNC